MSQTVLTETPQLSAAIRIFNKWIQTPCAPAQRGEWKRRERDREGEVDKAEGVR